MRYPTNFPYNFCLMHAYAVAAVTVLTEVRVLTKLDDTLVAHY